VCSENSAGVFFMSQDIVFMSQCGRFFQVAADWTHLQTSGYFLKRCGERHPEQTRGNQISRQDIQ
jgi:hypothetical protein